MIRLRIQRGSQCKYVFLIFRGPLRVWLKNENLPGLAMTRSVGDSIAASVGVTWEPEFLEYELDSKDKIVVIATDGVWEFLESVDVLGFY